MERTTPADVLAFWFGQAGEPDYGQPRAAWFRKDPVFDETIRQRFLPAVEAALAGDLNAWSADRQGMLALLILLDQFPRNLFRNTAQAFAGDPVARQLAEQTLAHGWDRQLLPVQRVFVYLPFEHSETLPDQERSLALFGALAAEQPGYDSYLDYARRHYEVIVRFGRFPHRNAVLGRPSTPEEADYLAQPGSGF